MDWPSTVAQGISPKYYPRDPGGHGGVSRGGSTPLDMEGLSGGTLTRRPHMGEENRCHWESRPVGPCTSLHQQPAQKTPKGGGHVGPIMSVIPAPTTPAPCLCVGLVPLWCTGVAQVWGGGYCDSFPYWYGPSMTPAPQKLVYCCWK